MGRSLRARVQTMGVAVGLVLCLVAGGTPAVATDVDVTPLPSVQDPQGDVNVRDSVVMAGTLYYVLNRLNAPSTLWRMDGETPVRLMDIESSSGLLYAVGDRLVVDDDSELFTLDAQGDKVVLAPSVPNLLRDVYVGNQRMYFSGSPYRSSRAQGLWVTDGTPDGTRRAHTVDGPREIELKGVWRDRAVFRVGSCHIWVSDGTASGTRRVSPARKCGPISVQQFATEGRRLWWLDEPYFPGPARGALWVSDGTRAGTRKATGFPSPRRVSSLASLGADQVAFAVKGTPTAQANLWVSNGRRTRQVTDFDPAAGLGLAIMGTVDGRVLFKQRLQKPNFFRSGHAPMREWLWSLSPGAVRATSVSTCDRQLLDVSGSRTSDFGPGYLPYAGGLAFIQQFPGLGAEVWMTDGTSRGTQPVVDAWPGPRGSRPYELAAGGSRLFFTADSPDRPLAWWRAVARPGSPPAAVTAPDSVCWPTRAAPQQVKVRDAVRYRVWAGTREKGTTVRITGSVTTRNARWSRALEPRTVKVGDGLASVRVTMKTKAGNAFVLKKLRQWRRDRSGARPYASVRFRFRDAEGNWVVLDRSTWLS